MTSLLQSLIDAAASGDLCPHCLRAMDKSLPYRNCENCDIPYQPKRDTSRHCSVRCQQTAAKRKLRSKAKDDAGGGVEAET
jgi:hypothetical protein